MPKSNERATSQCGVAARAQRASRGSRKRFAPQRLLAFWPARRETISVMTDPRVKDALTQRRAAPQSCMACSLMPQAFQETILRTLSQRKRSAEFQRDSRGAGPLRPGLLRATLWLALQDCLAR